MADDLKNRGPAHRTRINVHGAHELRYWIEKLGCAADPLSAPVGPVGVVAKDVDARLKKG